MLTDDFPLQSPSIPDIFDLVATFHPISDSWDSRCTSSKYTINGPHILLQHGVRVPYTFWNAFGTIKVKTGEKRKWRLKICKMDQQFWSKTCSVSMGIVPARQLPLYPDEMIGTFYDSTNRGYAYILGNGWLKHHESLNDDIKTYGTHIGVNDVIEMELDSKLNQSQQTQATNDKKGQLRFYVNRIDQGCAFSNVCDEYGGYVLAVSMWKGDEIKLLH